MTRRVVVATKHRGVFFGTLAGDPQPDSITLTDARGCVYWSAETRGFVGLAATGPRRGSRVTSAAPALTLYNITAVLDASDEAVRRWEEAPWS